MNLKAAVNRLRKHLVKGAEPEVNIDVCTVDKDHHAWDDHPNAVHIQWHGSDDPVIRHPDFVTKDCGALIVFFGKFKYVIEG